MPPLFVCEGGRRRVAVRLDLSGTAVPSLHLAKESQGKNKDLIRPPGTFPMLGEGKELHKCFAHKQSL